MQTTERDRQTEQTPKMRPRHFAYDPNLDEPARLLQQEAVDIEEEIAAEDSEPIETPDREDVPLPAFEE